MFQEIAFQRILPFIGSLAAGLIFAGIIIWQGTQLPLTHQNEIAILYTRDFGSGSAVDCGGSSPLCTTLRSEEVISIASRNITPLKITSKPIALYTDEARFNGIQGVVRLRVVLLSNSSVGAIQPISRLPFGLTEQAIAAARLVRFEPKKINGSSVNTTAVLEYGFAIY
jgi:hypothetical protein